MTENRRRQLESLYHEAADLSAEKRSAFLDRACTDPELRAEVDRLLELDGEEDDLEVPPVFDRLVSGSIPEQLGPYPILGELGRGGMGVVYLAEDPRLGRRIAIKVLPDPATGDPTRQERFEREARLLATMNHPNIATIHSLETDGDRHFLTMEAIAGTLLSARLKEGALPVDESLEITRRIAHAAEAAHHRGIVHRDLKTLNIRRPLQPELRKQQPGQGAPSVRQSRGSTGGPRGMPGRSTSTRESPTPGRPPE